MTTPERKGLLGIGILLAGLVAFAELSNWRAGRYSGRSPALPAGSAQADSWAPLEWKVPIADLPKQVSLYEAAMQEFSKDWDFVCVGKVVGGYPAVHEQTVDPPAEVVQSLKGRVPAFRPLSACVSSGEEVIETATGKRGGVTLILRGAQAQAPSIRFAVTWCCWAGWGVFRAELTQNGWVLKGTEQWFQS